MAHRPQVQIVNKKGLHARASAKFVQMRRAIRRRDQGDPRRRDRRRHLDHGPDDAGGGARHPITVEATGKQAAAVVAALVALIDRASAKTIDPPSSLRLADSYVRAVRQKRREVTAARSDA